MVSFALFSCLRLETSTLDVDILLYRPLGNGSDLSSLIQGIVILVIILISGVATSYQDFSTIKAMSSFKNLGGSRATVIRDGVKFKIPNSELIIGDLIVLKSGKRVPADCRIIEANSLKLDKSMLTGKLYIPLDRPKEEQT